MRCKPDGQICNGGFSQRKKFTASRLEVAIEDSCGMEEVDSVRHVADAMCAGISRKVALVANCDGFRIDEALSDAYFAMVEELHARHCSQATRYEASAFMRAKLGGALSTRQAIAAVFESKGEAMAFLWANALSLLSRTHTLCLRTQHFSKRCAIGFRSGQRSSQ